MAGRRAHPRTLAGATIAAIALSCTHDPPPPAPAPPDPLAGLRAFEAARRAETSFLTAPSSDRTFGPDPYALAALEDGTIAGILRGRDALVLLDASLEERARIPLPRGPSAIASYRGPRRGVLEPGDLLIASEIEPVLAHVRGTRRLEDVPLGDVVAARALSVTDEGVVHLVEEHDDRIVSLRFSAGRVERRERRVATGPARLARTRDTLYVASVAGHSVTALPLGRDGFPGEPAAIASIDGPFWALDAIDVDGGALVVGTGVEDHPLDRRGGFFGYVDSFVYVWFHRTGSTELTRVATINASELGVIVPKAVTLAAAPLRATLAAYGSAKLLRLAWPDGPDAPPAAAASDGIPGTSATAAVPGGVVAANPLLDAWVRLADGAPQVVHVADDAKRDERARLGEALFFTDLMAPANRSDGPLSRFTCETCHFEGYGDGRTHHTGRGDVRATTKPLVGLFNNRPHFSRALDPDLSAVAENEFRVAGAASGLPPHFTVEVARTPWLRELGLSRASYDAGDLRRSLMDFLMAFAHRTNPRAASHRSFTEQERAGAAAFRDRCEQCHQARAAADDVQSRVAFEGWERLVLSEAGPLVWASDAYAQTGVTPYVHDRGARVTSLRRLYKKRPYFTNGAAPDLRAVLRRARFGPGGFTHDGATEGEALDPTTIDALAAFLDLL